MSSAGLATPERLPQVEPACWIDVKGSGVEDELNMCRVQGCNNSNIINRYIHVRQYPLRIKQPIVLSRSVDYHGRELLAKR